jgi:hypothetical protein
MPPGQVQDPGSEALIKGTNPAGTQSQGDCGEQDVLRCSSRVLEAVEFATPLLVSTR